MKTHTKMEAIPQWRSERETGTASIHIDLRNGIITVTHGETADLLLKREVSNGFWQSKLWPCLEGKI